MKKIFFFSILFISTIANSQYGIYGGFSMLRPIAVGKSFYGLNIGAEMPKDDQTTLYLRGTFYLKQFDPNFQSIQLTNIDPNDYSINFVNSKNSMNYSVFEGGLRRYLGGYDNGFSLYGGTNLMGIIYATKSRTESFDQTLYTLPSANNINGSLLGLCVGLNGGGKYTFPGYGTAFFDISLDYMLRYFATNQNIPVTYLSPLLVSFNIGFRKEFY